MEKMKIRAGNRAWQNASSQNNQQKPFHKQEKIGKAALTREGYNNWVEQIYRHDNAFLLVYTYTVDRRRTIYNIRERNHLWCAARSNNAILFPTSAAWLGSSKVFVRRTHS